MFACVCPVTSTFTRGNPGDAAVTYKVLTRLADCNIPSITSRSLPPPPLHQLNQHGELFSLHDLA